MTSSKSSFDIAIVGGGPGGYVAALRAAQLKQRVALIERSDLGGICLNWGCIPTKSLLHTAETFRHMRHAGALGLNVGEITVDFERVVARSREVATRLNRGVAHLLKKSGVTVFKGSAAFSQSGRLDITTPDKAPLEIDAKHIILATGARPRALPMLPFGEPHVWSYREALAAKELPKSLVVIGAGAIGIEFARFFATLGSNVTVIEAQPRILPASDSEVSTFVQNSFERDGIRVLTGARVESAQTNAKDTELRVVHQGVTETVRGQRVLVAVGLIGNSDGIGLEYTRVRVEKGCILVDACGATSHAGIYAIGDVTGAPMLAHRASHQALQVIDHIAGACTANKREMALIPSCVYSYPQSASLGLTEDEARTGGRSIRVGRFPLEGNGKAVAIGETAGFVKTIFDEATGALLGAHIVGPDAPELIHGFALAHALEATEEELMHTVFPHPTLSEAMHESVLAAFGRALHV